METLQLRVTGVSGSPSQQSQGEGRETLWTSRQLIAGPTNHSHSH